MQGFWLAAGLIFLAELGDKTQLVALTFATRFKAGVVLGGIFVATLLVHVVSVGLGSLAGDLLPTAWVKLAAGIAFVGFGLWTLRGDSLDDEETKRAGLSPFWLVAVTFFLAELGDKTMLTTVTLAATQPVIPVWLGSTLGMVVSDGLAIWIGKALGSRLPENLLRTGAALVFFAFGVISVAESAVATPILVLALGLVAVAWMVWAIFRDARPRQPEKADETDRQLSAD
ncbi:MAG: TMEM165/GDT1 family protein [Symbiobacteriia bacterium]